MNRPYIICHMMSSVDGRIDCAMTEKLPGVEEYYSTLGELNAATTLSGKTTAKLELAESGEFKPSSAEKLRKEFPFPILGMEPAVAPAAHVCRNVLVLATPLTASSRRLHDLIARFPDCRFQVAALPDLAGAIERYFALREPLTLSDHLPEIACDGVVLGCTHYAFFRREIGMFYHVPVFDGAQGTANHLAELLETSKNCSNSGTDDHPQPQCNPNKCFIKK